MKPRYKVLLLLVCAATSTAAADPMRFPYWQMIKDIISNIETRPPRSVSMDENIRAADLEYPFEIFRHLRATDLLRAAREGIQEARLHEALGKSDAEIEALALRNVVLALQYLPMLIRHTTDLDELALSLGKRDEDRVLRLYLLENTFPGFAPTSLLSLTLPEIIDENDADFNKWTLRVATHPAEEPRLQNTALQIYYARLRREYERLIAEEPETEIVFIESVSPSRARELEQNEDTALAYEWSLRLRIMRNRFYDFAGAIAGHIAEGSVRDEQVKQTTRHILEDMRDNIRYMDQDIINAHLAGKPRSDTALPQIPQLPTPFPESPLDNTAAPPHFGEILEQMGPPGF